LQACQDVADTLSALEFDASELKAQDAAVQTERENLELTQSQYQTGAVSYLYLIISERNYLRSNIERINAQARRYADTAALFQALGGGWWNRTDLATDRLAEQQNKRNQ
jgi:outer membrane protein TolC